MQTCEHVLATLAFYFISNLGKKANGKWVEHRILMKKKSVINEWALEANYLGIHVAANNLGKEYLSNS